MINPEALTARLFREWLLQELPASIATVNAGRAAVLRSPQPGPFVITALAVLKVSITDKAGTTSSCPLTTGAARTTTQVAADINAVVPGLASVDADDHLLITSTTAPSFTAPLTTVDSIVAVGSDDTGANTALGFDVSGEFVLRTALVPPGLAGICDGLPLGNWFDPSQLGLGRVLITIGERTAAPKDDSPRRFEFNASLDVSVFRAEPQQVYSTREPIQAALQAVRAVLHTDMGMSLGPAGLRAGVGYGRIGQAKVSGQPLTFMRVGQDGAKSMGPLFDAAQFPYLCRVYQAS